MHPNLENNDALSHRDSLMGSRLSEKHRKGCVASFKRFDENVLKPALIYLYNKRSYKKLRSFYHKFQDEGEQME